MRAKSKIKKTPKRETGGKKFGQKIKQTRGANGTELACDDWHYLDE